MNPNSGPHGLQRQEVDEVVASILNSGWLARNLEADLYPALVQALLSLDDSDSENVREVVRLLLTVALRKTDIEFSEALEIALRMTRRGDRDQAHHTA